MNLDKNSLFLYAVTDRSWLHEKSLLDEVELALKGGVTFLQLREKNLAYEDFLKEAQELKILTKKYKVPLIINDNIEIAIASNADGIHLGQSDLKISAAKKRLGNNKIIGASVQNLEQALLAQKHGADYLGVGAIFPTSTKSDADLVGINTLKEICHKVKIPVVAIGGINKNNLIKLKDCGIKGVALVSAIFAEKDPKKASIGLKGLLKEVITP